MNRIDYEELPRIVPDTRLWGSFFTHITLKDNGNSMKNLSEILYLAIFHNRQLIYNEAGNRAFEIVFHSEDKALTLRALMEISDLICSHTQFKKTHLIAHTLQQKPTTKFPFRATTFLTFISGEQLEKYVIDNNLMFIYNFDDEEKNLNH